MHKNKKLFIFTCILILFVTVIGVSKSNFIFGTSKGAEEVIVPNYQKLNSIIPSILNEFPEIRSDLQIIKDIDRVSESFNKVQVESILNVNKTQFRLEVQDLLINQNGGNGNREVAQNIVDNYLNALAIARDDYEVNITQEEVTKYIEQNVSDFTSEDKRLYANSLGLTEYELDFVFDRDIYVMDTLWNRLIPVLMDKYPKGDDEENDVYLERIKSTFYSNK